MLIHWLLRQSMMDKVQYQYHQIIYSRWRQSWWCLDQGFSRNLICIIEVGGEEFNISVMRFGVGGERNLSRPCRNVRSGSRCQEISALVTLCCWTLIWLHGINGQSYWSKFRWQRGCSKRNSGNKDDKCILEQLITKIVLLLEVDDVDSPTKGALTYEQGAESLVGSQL